MYVVYLKSSVNGLIKTQKQILGIRILVGLQRSPHQTQRSFDNVRIASGNCQKSSFLELCLE